MDASTMIIEGFICPECQQDMSTADMLRNHFELVHSAGAATKTSQATNGVDELAKRAEITHVDGFFRSHTTELRRQRDNTVGRYVVQTNKLLITLDRLVSIDLDTHRSEQERDAHYKSIVAWISDDDVSLCPNCARAFTLLFMNRKHHCRLCGAIMCAKCSLFISFAMAKWLTGPHSSTSDTDESVALSPSSQSPEFKLKRSDSITSLNPFTVKSLVASSLSVASKVDERASSLMRFGSSGSAASSSSKEPLDAEHVYMRLCKDCSRAIEKKYESLREKAMRPKIVELYDELYKCVEEARSLYPMFAKMAHSLGCGESVYQLEQAEEMRMRLIRLYQQIESLSGKILKHNAQPDDTTTATKGQADNANNRVTDHFKLQRNIRMYAIGFLKEYSFSLPTLPARELYEQLKQRRQAHLLAEMEQQRAASQLRRSHAPRPLPTKIIVDNSNGWVAGGGGISGIGGDGESSAGDGSSSSGDNESSDGAGGAGAGGGSEERSALRIQIQLVESYIREAKKHNKTNEVEILERNLNELLNALVDIK